MKIGITAAIVAIIILIATYGGFFQVDQGERAVLLRNGKITDVAEPGLGFKTPLLDSVRFISVRDP